MTNSGTGNSLPEIVDESVSAHFREHAREIEESIKTKIEDVQLHLLDNFFRNIQSTYSDRIALLEATTRMNDETLKEIQASSEHAAYDLQRLTNGIRGLIGDGLVSEGQKR